MGIAVQSHWFSVGSTVAWGEAGVGIIATQGVVNVGFGPIGLAMLKKGFTPQTVIDSLLKNDPERNMRQVAVLDVKGNIAAYTGKSCVGEAGHTIGESYSAQANTAESTEVWPAMGKAFDNTSGTLGYRMVTALAAAQAKGGDIRGQQSASLLIVRTVATGKPWIDRKIDLRVDDQKAPIDELKRLYTIQSAYNAVNIGYYYLAKDELLNADKYFKQAQTLYPDNKEIPFWYAVELANKGAVEQALPIFKQVFDSDISWKDKMLPRIVKAGVLTVNEDTLNKIKQVR